MNCYMNGQDVGRDYGGYQGYQVNRKTAEITRPGPSSAFVLLDEHENSIDDGHYGFNPEGDLWMNLPAMWHNSGCNFSFADGHAEILKWHDPRTLALKVINKELLDGGEEGVRRFLHEAKVAGGLTHPNIVVIYELGVEKGAPFIAMEYLPGRDLRELIADRTPLTLGQKVGILLQVARARDDGTAYQVHRAPPVVIETTVAAPSDIAEPERNGRGTATGSRCPPAACGVA